MKTYRFIKADYDFHGLGKRTYIRQSILKELENGNIRTVMRILVLTLVMFMSGCASTSVPNTFLQDNNDVFILSALVQDHLRKTNGESTNLSDLVKRDTLNKISNSFETVELQFKGHISVYYKFSESRDSKGITPSDKEKELAKNVRWTEKKLKSQNNGEIQLYYGERFYTLKKIIVAKRPN